MSEIFEFDGGGAYHPSGYGQWQVRVADSSFSASHNTAGAITNYGPTTLQPGDSATLWQLIQAANIGSLKASTRAGIPDEARYSFGLVNDDVAAAVRIWANDARRNSALLALINGIVNTIEAYTGQKAII